MARQRRDGVVSFNSAGVGRINGDGVRRRWLLSRPGEQLERDDAAQRRAQPAPAHRGGGRRAMVPRGARAPATALLGCTLARRPILTKKYWPDPNPSTFVRLYLLHQIRRAWDGSNQAQG